jgi:hypothetical protein
MSNNLQSLSLLLQGENVVPGLECRIEAWNSTQMLFSKISEISTQTIVHFSEIQGPIQLIMTNCKKLADGTPFEAFPSVFTISRDEVDSKHFIRRLVFFRPTFPIKVERGWAYNIILTGVLFILAIIILSCFGFVKQKEVSELPPRKTPKHFQTETSDHDSPYHSATPKKEEKRYIYEPPLRLAAKMSEEDKQLLSRAFCAPSFKSYSRDEVTTPEDAEDTESTKPTAKCDTGNGVTVKPDCDCDIDRPEGIPSEIATAYAALCAATSSSDADGGAALLDVVERPEEGRGPAAVGVGDSGPAADGGAGDVSGAVGGEEEGAGDHCPSSRRCISVDRLLGWPPLCSAVRAGAVSGQAIAQIYREASGEGRRPAEQEGEPSASLSERQHGDQLSLTLQEFFDASSIIQKRIASINHILNSSKSNKKRNNNTEEALAQQEHHSSSAQEEESPPSLSPQQQEQQEQQEQEQESFSNYEI